MKSIIKYGFTIVFLVGLFIITARIVPAFIMSLGWPTLILAALVIGFLVSKKVKA